MTDRGVALYGVLVTFRRPQELAKTLATIAGQGRRLDRLIVVDNAPSAESEGVVRSWPSAAEQIEYLPLPHNAGFSGGLAAGTAEILRDARDDDWVVVLDDDDPPYSPGVFGELLRFAEEMVALDPATGAVGVKGARFDRRRGKAVRVSNSAIEPVTPADFIAGNGFPLYKVGPLRRVGGFTDEIFFSYEDLEIGLRLLRGGFTVYLHGAMLTERRTTNLRPDILREGGWRIAPPNWRTYYSFRNTIAILRQNGLSGVALRVSLVRGFLKPLFNIPLAPRSAWRTLLWNWRAGRDAWLGRMGPRVEPVSEQARPNKVIPVASPADWATSKEAH